MMILVITMISVPTFADDNNDGNERDNNDGNERDNNDGNERDNNDGNERDNVDSNVTPAPELIPQPTLQGSIDVKLDKISYTNGDVLSYSGIVINGEPGVDVSVTLSAPNGDLITIDQLPVGLDNTFSSSFTTGGALWVNNGSYTILVQSGTLQNTVEFQFTDVVTVPLITSNIINIFTDNSTYISSDLVTISVNAANNANVAINVSDFTGNNIVTRTITTDDAGNGSIQFKLSTSAKNGTYIVDATAIVSGVDVSNSITFLVNSTVTKINIVSLSPVDQMGNPVSSFTIGKLSFAKVILDSVESTPSLVTVNLFDSQLTSLGIGSFKTVLNPGQSEMSLSFFIPNDAKLGNMNIYANVFSDWPSQGGVPLTGESSTSVILQ